MNKETSEVAVDRTGRMDGASLHKAPKWDEGPSHGRTIADYRDVAVILALAMILWLPRLAGPVDLRWDAGVYYLLGTSLAEGHGYRIPSEPGAPEAVQYPPLLPAFVALHERALGTTDPAVVAPWLRLSYAALFLAYALAAFALARRYLPGGWALIAAALAVLHVMSIFLSDLLFAEIPFALVSVMFALVSGNRTSASRPWIRETTSYALAAVGFLLRTVGVALLAAWVLEALVQKRWRLTLVRAGLALLPVILWQAHVTRVQRSEEYTRPAYEYQRAAYQYYNVSYAENILLVDSFRPELGHASAGVLASRMVTNLARVVPALGEMVSTKTGYWMAIISHAQHRLLGRSVLRASAILLAMTGLATLVVIGLALLVRLRAWPMVFTILGSIGLICTTPWPGQFTRYLGPLTPFLTICAVLAMSRIPVVLRRKARGRAATFAQVAAGGILLVTFAAQSYAALDIFRERRSDGARVIGIAGGKSDSRLFFHDRSWQNWEKAIDWIKEHSAPDAIIATSSPHFCYLRSGRLAVLPPMEANPERARHLLEAVPASYVIVDELGFVDISRRYAGPAVESDSARWPLVMAFDNTKVYERAR